MTAAAFSVGSIECRLLAEGDAWPPAEIILANAPESERAVAVSGSVDEQGRFHAPYQALLVRTPTSLVLVDGGIGEFPHIFEGGGGRLLDELHALDIEADDIDLVIATHGHHDHVGGLTRSRRPIFTGTPHLLSWVEWEFWMNDSPLHEQYPPQLVEGCRAALAPIMEGGLFELVDPGLEPVPGLRLLAAPGHTPGQLAVELRSEGQLGLFLADVVVHPAQAEHPDWCSVIELAAAETVEATRRALLGRAVEEGCLVAASHLWAPVTVERAGAGFTLTPV